MRNPVTAEKRVGRVRQGHISILCAFAAMNMDELPFTVDVGDLQKKPFLEPQAAGIDGGKENEIMKSHNLAQNAVDFLP